MVLPLGDAKAAEHRAAPLRRTEGFSNVHQIALLDQYSSDHPGKQDVSLAAHAADNDVQGIHLKAHEPISSLTMALKGQISAQTPQPQQMSFLILVLPDLSS